MAVKKKAPGWELITDLETYGKVTEKRLREQLERLERREIKFLVLQPSRMIGETAFLQASYEFDPADGMLYGIEFGFRLKDGENMIMRNYPAPQSQLEKIFEEYFTAHRVPNFSGWLFVNVFGSGPLMGKGQLHWNFPSQPYQDTHTFVEAVNAFSPGNAGNWHPDFTAVAYPVCYLDLLFCEKEAPHLRENEKLIKKEEIPGSPYSRFIVKARIQAENKMAFTEGELLKAVHNQLAGRYTGIWKEAFILKRTEAKADGPLLSFYRGPLGRRAMGIASSGEQSLYQKIHHELEEKGSLSPDFTLRPPKESQKSSFIDGFPDGVGYHHAYVPMPVPRPLKKAFRLASQGDGVAAENCLKAFFADPDEILLPYMDALSSWLYRHQESLDVYKLLDFAWNLMERSGEIECVKAALFLTAQSRHPWEEKDKEMLRELGQADEFTFHVLRNIENWENRDAEIFQLAQKVHGWGRIFAIHQLQPCNEEVKAWLLHEGIDNIILPEYSSLEAAQKIDLTEVVRNCQPDSADLLDAGKILCSMIKGGPAPGIEAYHGKKELLRSFLEKIGKAEPDGTLYQMAFYVQQYAERTHRKKIVQQAEQILQTPVCLEYLQKQQEQGNLVFLAAMEGLDAAQGAKIAFRRDWEANFHLLHLLDKPADIQEMADFFVEKVAGGKENCLDGQIFLNLEMEAYQTILQVIDESQVDIDEEKLLQFGLTLPGKSCKKSTRAHIQRLKEQGRLSEQLEQAAAL